MYTDFEGTGSGVTTAEGGGFGRLGDDVSGENAQMLQEQVDSLLQSKHDTFQVDQRTIEEEAQKLAKRVEVGVFNVCHQYLSF